MEEKELIKYLDKYFIYNLDGTLQRTDRKNSNGSYDKDGYLILKIKSKQYKAHRIVFAIHNKRLPIGEIDHINRNKKDNRIENLSECTRLDNVSNSMGSGFGIYIDNTKGLKKKYSFKLKGKTYRFYSIEEAIKNKLKLGGKINYEYDIPKID